MQVAYGSMYLFIQYLPKCFVITTVNIAERGVFVYISIQYYALLTVYTIFSIVHKFMTSNFSAVTFLLIQETDFYLFDVAMLNYVLKEFIFYLLQLNLIIFSLHKWMYTSCSCTISAIFKIPLIVLKWKVQKLVYFHILLV